MLVTGLNIVNIISTSSNPFSSKHHLIIDLSADAFFKNKIKKLNYHSHQKNKIIIKPDIRMLSSFVIARAVTESVCLFAVKTISPVYIRITLIKFAAVPVIIYSSEFVKTEHKIGES